MIPAICVADTGKWESELQYDEMEFSFASVEKDSRIMIDDTHASFGGVFLF